MERDGLLIRADHGTVPPRVDYELTGVGRSLLEPLAAICTWNEQHIDEVAAARNRHDRAD
jgi:DNA-binding HxlR family transcriptional regulator